MSHILETHDLSAKILPLVERYRPHTLADIVGQDNVVAVLRGYVERKNMPNLMLSGDSGVGKTSSTFAFIRDFYAAFGINRLESMVLSINASQENGIDTIRNQIMPFATSGFQTMPDIIEQLRITNMYEKHVPKIIVLDEADALTTVAQWALGPIIDTTSDNVRYIFIVNYQRKIQSNLQSRCQVLRFPPLTRQSVNALISKVCLCENIRFEPSAAAAIGVIAQSDMRMALNILSSCIVQKKDAALLTEAFVYNAAGRVEPRVTLQLLRDVVLGRLTLRQTCLRLDSHIESNNLSLSQVLCDLHETCLRLTCGNIGGVGDNAASINDPILLQQFGNEHFAVAVFEHIDETEQHLLAITDIARMQVQTRAFAAGVWSIVEQHENKKSDKNDCKI